MDQSMSMVGIPCFSILQPHGQHRKTRFLQDASPCVVHDRWGSVCHPMHAMDVPLGSGSGETILSNLDQTRRQPRDVGKRKGARLGEHVGATTGSCEDCDRLGILTSKACSQWPSGRGSKRNIDQTFLDPSKFFVRPRRVEVFLA